MSDTYSKIIVSFRGEKVEIPLESGVSVGTVKARVLASVAASGEQNLSLSDLKLMYKGRILSNDSQDMHEILIVPGRKPPKTFRLMATGLSSTEAIATNQEFEQGLKRAPRIRNDLNPEGQMEIAHRQALGRKLLNIGRKPAAPKYGFGKIETLPMLPEQDTAKHILQTLANDPGILACMAKHKWNVGSLAELYPEGKVGESEVCVMGLNKNKGQQILLRIRTDDLKGFRKMLSIRKVLFHELAHNVHSEHNGDFFQLMRQIEKECNELDWTQGAGLSSSVEGYESATSTLYSGGSFRLGGSDTSTRNVPVRELAARAAMMRLTKEEEEIFEHCGCGKQVAVTPTTEAPMDIDSESSIEGGDETASDVVSRKGVESNE